MDSHQINLIVDEALRRGPGGSPLYDAAVEFLQALPEGPALPLQPLIDQYDQADAARRLPGNGIQLYP